MPLCLALGSRVWFSYVPVMSSRVAGAGGFVPVADIGAAEHEAGARGSYQHEDAGLYYGGYREGAQNINIYLEVLFVYICVCFLLLLS